MRKAASPESGCAAICIQLPGRSKHLRVLLRKFPYWGPDNICYPGPFRFAAYARTGLQIRVRGGMARTGRRCPFREDSDVSELVRSGTRSERSWEIRRRRGAFLRNTTSTTPSRERISLMWRLLFLNTLLIWLINVSASLLLRRASTSPMRMTCTVGWGPYGSWITLTGQLGAGMWLSFGCPMGKIQGTGLNYLKIA